VNREDCDGNSFPHVYGRSNGQQIKHAKAVYRASFENYSALKGFLVGPRRRRDHRGHLIPEPQPSSCGSISQEMPLRNTKMRPARHTRFAKRGLPPLGFVLEVGMNGSTSSHNLSGKSAMGTWTVPQDRAYARSSRGIAEGSTGLLETLRNNVDIELSVNSALPDAKCIAAKEFN
jgi:hypothetical protein